MMRHSSVFAFCSVNLKEIRMINEVQGEEAKACNPIGVLNGIGFCSETRLPDGRRLIYDLSALYETLIHAQSPPSCGPVCGTDLRVSAAAADLHLRDSNAWGTRQYLLSRSAGETYHIGNATEVDVPYFEGIRGLSAPVYRDGTIYLHILSDEEWRNSESVTVFENEIRKRMEASGNEALLPTAFSYEYAHGISTDPSHLSGQRSLLLVNMLVILLSVSVVRSAYRSHLKRFSSDVGTLLACGASRHQISALFAAELAAVFLLAAACAVVISVVSLKALFTAFLEIRHDSLAWLIFHVEPMNILLHLAVFFVTLGLSLGMHLHRYSREPAQKLLNDAENMPKVKRGRKPSDGVPPRRQPSAACGAAARTAASVPALPFPFPSWRFFCFCSTSSRLPCRSRARRRNGG